MGVEKFEHTDTHGSHILVTCDDAGLTVSTQKQNADGPGTMVYFSTDEAWQLFEALTDMLGLNDE